MITSIKYENYKAFEKAEIPIKPITILIGANSVGKSSIIQSLLMFQQTGKAGLKSYKSALKLYGGYVNLGNPINLFRLKNTKKNLSFSFKLKSLELKKFLKNELGNSFNRIFIEIPMFLPFKGFSDIRFESGEINNKKEFEKILDTLIVFLSKETTKSIYKDEVEYFLKHRYEFSVPEINKKNKSEILSVYNFLQKLNKNIKTDEFEISFELSLNSDDVLEIKKFKTVNNNNVIIEFNKNSNTLSLSSDFINFTEKDTKEFAKLFAENNTIFNCFRTTFIGDEISVKINIISKLMHNIQLILQNEFAENKINYVSPLRAHPKRYYMLDKAKLNLTLDTLDGDAIAEVLKENKILTNKVNNWLKKFDISVNVKEFKEVIHQLVVKQNNIDLDITDVGFGISQILPVIIQGFLSNPNSTTIIEQPEIHLHPKIQADLADLFIDIIKSSRKRKLIIETHSEYLLKRIRRRISEGKIKSEDVAICIFHPQNKKNGAVIEVLEIKEKGFFIWPEDFYGGELYKDTTEFLINQK